MCIICYICALREQRQTKVVQKKQNTVEKLRISSENIFAEKVASLYESAFPLDERRETGDFFRLLDENESFHADVFLTESGQFAGFLTSWEWESFRYGEHFAVEPSLRCGGIGSQILRSFVASDSRPLIIEVEPPVGELEKRRIAFYERNGFKLWDKLHYVQPSYGAGRDAIELKLMTCGDIVLSGGDDGRIRCILRDVYGVR